jgi:hypothetical protein
MTNIRVWGWTGIILAAFVIGAMLASDSISFAQEDSTTPTPVPTESTGGSTDATPTPAPSDGEKSGDHNCPERDADDGTTESSTSTSDA